MEKTATLNLRVNPIVKGRAEEVLSRLGIPMSTAIDMYLNQISLTGGIPFAVTLPKAPDAINTDLMTTGELHAKLQKGYDDIEAGNVQNAKSAFASSVDMFYPELAKQVKYFKETEGGREIMCQIFEDLAEKRANERAEEVREETRIETLFNLIKSLMNSMKWTAEQVMTAMNVSENDQMLLETRF